MVPLPAEILSEEVSADGRSAVRRSLRLGVSAHTSGSVTMALVLNISESGLLIETLLNLDVGETLLIDLPEASASAVQVIWRKGLLAGCEFVETLPKPAISAAQLLSPNQGPASLVEAPIANDPRVDAPTSRDDSIERMIVLVTSSVSVIAVLILLAAILAL